MEFATRSVADHNQTSLTYRSRQKGSRSLPMEPDVGPHDTALPTAGRPDHQRQQHPRDVDATMKDEIVTAAGVVGWAAKKVLGPTFDLVGDDLAKLYAAGRDKIIASASKKIPNLDDGKQANLRVSRDVLWNGAFSTEDICAEYFGGILASARSENGKDDSAIPFVDVIKSLSSEQLRNHYFIYRALGKILSESNSNKEGQHIWDVVKTHQVYIPASGLRPDIDLGILKHHGLIDRSGNGSSILSFSDNKKDDRALPYLVATPTVFGVMLYAAAYNKLEWWQAYGIRSYEDFDDIECPELYATSLEELKSKAYSRGL